MAPTKLKKLKEQLKDFLDKDFIHTDNSSCGSPILFIRK